MSPIKCRKFILLVVFLFQIPLIACSLSEAEFEPTSTAYPTNTSTITPVPTNTPTDTPQPTPTTIPLGGGGGLIAFVSDRTGGFDLHTIHTITGEKNHYPTGEDCSYCAENPHWSSDGSKIIFSGKVYNSSLSIYGQEIFIYDYATDEIRMISDWDGGYAPNLSMDGEKIAFISGREGALRLYTMNINGRNVKKFTDGLGYVVSAPSWSPDGRSVVLAHAENIQADAEIIRVDLNGLGFEKLTDNSVSDVDPVWSPDGRKIAFVSKRDGNSEIYIMNADGTEPTRMTFTDSQERWPQWSPDGKWLSYHLWVDGNIDIYILDVNRQESIRITDHSAPDLAAAWSPDGSMLAFISLRNDPEWEDCTNTQECNSDIYLIDISTQELTQLTNSLSADISPSWQPMVIIP